MHSGVGHVQYGCQSRHVLLCGAKGEKRIVEFGGPQFLAQGLSDALSLVVDEVLDLGLDFVALLLGCEGVPFLEVAGTPAKALK